MNERREGSGGGDGIPAVIPEEPVTADLRPSLNSSSTSTSRTRPPGTA
jgi:hypothetical protein